MTIIGITGPTGAGKTTALYALRELGAEIIDADAVYHRLLAECEDKQVIIFHHRHQVKKYLQNLNP